MAKRRGRGTKAPEKVRLAWEKRVRRTAQKVKEGKVVLGDIKELALRAAVEDAESPSPREAPQ